MYDPKSKCADDFINHEEIMETLEYAEKNKHNRELIDQILDKARLRKGLSHREAAVLLDCDLEDKNQEIYALAEQIKKDFYGNRTRRSMPWQSRSRRISMETVSCFLRRYICLITV